jgi:hypothetical protein
VTNDPKKANTVGGLNGLKNPGWAASITGIFQMLQTLMIWQDNDMQDKYGHQAADAQ